MQEADTQSSTNVLGRPLQTCSLEPKTGFFRDGCCKSSSEDTGLHIVCAFMTREFLLFSRAKGNDLTTPRPEHGFPGLKPGDQWCLCAQRWIEAAQAKAAPAVFLEGTHESVLKHIPMETLLDHAMTPSDMLPN